MKSILLFTRQYPYGEHENFIDAEGYRLSEIAEAKHKNEMKKLDDEIIERKKNLEALDLENKKRQAEIENLKAQVDILIESLNFCKN